MPTRRTFLLALALQSASCFDPTGVSPEDSTSSPADGGAATEPPSEGGSTGETAAGTADGTADGTAGGTADADDTTTAPTTGDTTTSGGCMPGVFGASRFGDACFQ